jgi:hypothetical protein
MVLRAWYMDSSEADQREPHQLAPNQPVSAAHLDRLGVLSWSLDMAGPPDANATLNAIRKERGYSYMDIITISPEKLENYEGKLKIFFKEHLHTDEEIRLILVRARGACATRPGRPATCACANCPCAHNTHTPTLPAPHAGGHGLL